MKSVFPGYYYCFTEIVLLYSYIIICFMLFIGWVKEDSNWSIRKIRQDKWLKHFDKSCFELVSDKIEPKEAIILLLLCTLY